MPNPVQYAEDTLGVHTILEGTMKAHDELDKIVTVLANAKDDRRKAEQDLSDFEMEVAIEERGKHADMSATAMQAHLKQHLYTMPKWRELRDKVRELTNDIDGAELDRKIQERAIEIGNARMNELGGYLHYLAACKQASLVKPSEA